MKNLIYIFSLVLVFSCATKAQAQNYNTHRVKSGETIESIAKQYSVTPYDIYSLNPDAKKELKENAVLIIPASKIATPKTTSTTVKEFQHFIEHKVKRKETLYSLAKKYNVTQDEIKKHNPSLYANNLRKGDKIKIPVYKTKTVVETVKTTKDYTVLPKEGKWRIAYKYGITVEELDALNPNMPAILNVGQVIQVPNLETTEVKQIDDRYSYYTVLPKEGFYRLKLKLQLEQEELEALNPTLKETGLKSGMVLKIPYSNTIAETGEVTNTTIATTVATTSLINNIRNFESKNIAILLPFRLNRVNADSVFDAKNQIQSDRFLSTSLDFYSGVLLAVDSLKKLGISLKVDVYDTKNQLSEVSNLVRSKNLENADAVIGPLMPKNFEYVASHLKENNVPVISPNLKDLKLSENVFQSMPSSALLKTKMINFVKADSTKSHVIIIADAKNAATSNGLKREFSTASQIHSRKDKEGKDSYYVLKDDIVGKLKPGKNIIFLETQNYTFVSNVTSILNSLNNEENKIVLATTDMNSAFENDEISNYHLSNLNFHFPSVSKTYTEENTNGFVQEYKKKYGDTPNKTAVRGFDLMLDVVLRLSASESIYNSVNQFPLTEYLENKFAYHKNLFGGYYNNTVYVVKYNDLQIVDAQ
ncbi:LysM peptidoglycan-binding domain-containing protein [Lacinutrix sp. C3R15]|uniref:amino acid ABC transporter substrate-binding protein n=1 Tax=Flavobacteriaceae TaxID=49546 RepID=UPI001C0A4A0D|nr:MULTISPECIES: LysM peptidoglycan-binding domain-containing protein [Flavobacteriaceae]MBU2939513.1 LysM peptidoglycan-binding domain-containing protein [Lacinutrix sp. C3R15]MDO6622828.1 LysM peptidoglycan-binding domain-containing protein [Oceanihabitans sp. 1_MG-2023]